MFQSKKGHGGEWEQGRVWGRLPRVRSLASELLPHHATHAKQSVHWVLGVQNLHIAGLASPRVKPSVKGFVFLKGLPWVASSPTTLCPSSDPNSHRQMWLMEVWTSIWEACIAATLCDSGTLGLSHSSTK